MDRQSQEAVAALAADHQSSASAMLPRALTILRAARRRGQPELSEVGRALCLAQPCMASIWNAVGIALGGSGADGVLDRFEQRAVRAPQALARFARDVLAGVGPARPADPIRIATCSSSRSVLVCLRALAKERSLRVACAEGRPLFEGREMATALSSAGLAVDFFTDAGVGAALEAADAVIVGADSVAANWIINKCGTRQLAAAAVGLGVPVYVAGGRDKFVAPALEGLLTLRGGLAAEVWAEAPPNVSVWNPYFEKVPIELVAGVISDAGVLAGDAVAQACAAASRDLAIAELVRVVA